jgi:outer membrane protein OmpA-like peptidoglycan-associated protein
VAPAPAPAQVASTGTPQPGSTPFEPSGPLYLAPGSLNRNPQEAAATPSPSTTPSTTEVAATPAAPTNITATPMPSSTPTPSTAPTGEAVSVDYSVLNGLGATPSPSAPVLTPAMTATNAQMAGVGQAVGYVYFNNGSSHLSESDRAVLQQVVQLQRIQGGVLRIVGHASQRTGNMDALAQDQVNKRVSLERATAVAQALVGMGVQPMLVQVAAVGDGQTLYSESTPAGEAGNRRAEVYLSQN